MLWRLGSCSRTSSMKGGWNVRFLVMSMRTFLWHAVIVALTMSKNIDLSVMDLLNKQFFVYYKHIFWRWLNFLLWFHIWKLICVANITNILPICTIFYTFIVDKKNVHLEKYLVHLEKFLSQYLLSGRWSTVESSVQVIE